MNRFRMTLWLMCWSALALAQEQKLVLQGNRLYQQQRYKEAASAYQEAIKKNPSFVPGSFNLSNAFFRQKQYEAARNAMQGVAKNAKDKNARAGASYNIGNTFMEQQQWQQAVDAYKQSLRSNPADVDAKYNLSYALAKLKQEQQKGGGKDKNKDKNKDDQNQKDKKEQDKKNGKEPEKPDESNNKKPDQKEGQNPKPESGNKQEPEGQQHPEPQPSKLTEQQADNLLKALQQDERKLQDKLQKGKGQPVKTDKDW